MSFVGVAATKFGSQKYTFCLRLFEISSIEHRIMAVSIFFAQSFSCEVLANNDKIFAVENM